MIVERVEVDRDAVFVAEVVAVGDGGTDGRRVLRVGDDPEINRIRRIKDARLGALLGGSAGGGWVLMEAGQPRGLGPGRLTQRPIDRDGGTRDSRNVNGGTARAVV